MPLTDALADILLVMLHCQVIEGRFRLEIADLEIHSTVPKAMSQDRNKTIGLHSIFKALVKLPQWVRIALLLKALPYQRLGGLYESHQRFYIQRHINGITIAGVIRLLIAPCRAYQVFFYICFKLFLILCHCYHLLNLFFVLSFS
jgi:hypothetical protein